MSCSTTTNHKVKWNTKLEISQLDL